MCWGEHKSTGSVIGFCVLQAFITICRYGCNWGRKVDPLCILNLLFFFFILLYLVARITAPTSHWTWEELLDAFGMLSMVFDSY